MYPPATLRRPSSSRAHRPPAEAAHVPSSHPKTPFLPPVAPIVLLPEQLMSPPDILRRPSSFQSRPPSSCRSSSFNNNKEWPSSLFT